MGGTSAKGRVHHSLLLREVHIDSVLILCICSSSSEQLTEEVVATYNAVVAVLHLGLPVRHCAFLTFTSALTTYANVVHTVTME